jgi:hypothetical protein
MPVHCEHVPPIVQAWTGLIVGAAAVDRTKIDVVGVVLDARQRVGEIERERTAEALARADVEAVELTAAGRLVLFDEPESARHRHDRPRRIRRCHRTPCTRRH